MFNNRLEVQLQYVHIHPHSCLDRKYHAVQKRYSASMLTIIYKDSASALLTRYQIHHISSQSPELEARSSKKSKSHRRRAVRPDGYPQQSLPSRAQKQPISQSPRAMHRRSATVRVGQPAAGKTPSAGHRKARLRPPLAVAVLALAHRRDVAAAADGKQDPPPTCRWTPEPARAS